MPAMCNLVNSHPAAHRPQLSIWKLCYSTTQTAQPKQCQVWHIQHSCCDLAKHLLWVAHSQQHCYSEQSTVNRVNSIATVNLWQLHGCHNRGTPSAHTCASCTTYKCLRNPCNTLLLNTAQPVILNHKQSGSPCSPECATQAMGPRGVFSHPKSTQVRHGVSDGTGRCTSRWVAHNTATTGSMSHFHKRRQSSDQPLTPPTHTHPTTRTLKTSGFM